MLFHIPSATDSKVASLQLTLSVAHVVLLSQLVDSGSGIFVILLQSVAVGVKLMFLHYISWPSNVLKYSLSVAIILSTDGQFQQNETGCDSNAS